MENFIAIALTLLSLVAIQAVLGFDNLLYIVIESNKVGNEEDAKKVRVWGIGIAVVLRIVLLIILVGVFEKMAGPLFGIHLTNFIEGEFNFQSLITLFGGGFIIYTAMKEIHHMLAVEHIEHSEGSARHTVGKAVMFIVLMNLVFSFDSILTAISIAETAPENTRVVLMAIAIILSGIAMIALAGRVTEFLKKNRMYQILGLFILFLVGVLLVTEGAHLAHLKLFGFEIAAMEKATFYLVVGVLVVTDIISSRYQKRLWAQKEAEILGGAAHPEAGLEAVDKVMGH